MNNLLPTIDDLKRYVKINASIPYESVLPFIIDAMDIYLVPQIGQTLSDKANEGKDAELTERVCRSLGPLSLSLATDELGIQYGDSGITVDNIQGKRSPANEAKIAAAKQNLFFRGMQALDRLLSYLSANPDKYPEYKVHESTFLHPTCYIRSALEFQEEGLVQIESSTLTYRTMLPTIRQLQETTLVKIIPLDLANKLKERDNLSTQEKVLLALIIRFLANKTAEIYTSQSSREQREAPGTPEFKPVIRPLYHDIGDTGNFFGRQADFYLRQLCEYIELNAEAFGITPSNGAMDFNTKERKVFTSII